jgi:hypothetical protein
VFVQIRNVFRIPVPPDQAWVVLNDVPRVARCAPGAQLLEQRDDGSHVGTVAVRLGPVALSFKGTFAYKEKDEAAHRVVAEASGNEAKARGTARALVTFQLAPDGEGTKVNVESDVQLAGPIAQYGRGAALIQSTAQAIIDQFAANLSKQIMAGGVEPMPEPAAPALSSAAPEAEARTPAAAPEAAPDAAPEAAIAELRRTITELQRTVANLASRVAVLETPPVKPISAFGLLGQMLRNWLFGRKT